MQLPQAFKKQMMDMLQKEYNEFESALSSTPPISIRRNPLKPVSDFNGSTLPDGEVGWCRTGEYLPTRPSFTTDPLFHAGCYYVQEASSMFIEQFIVQHAPSHALTALDLCAAPGGKSTLLQTLLPPGSLLFSNEINRQRSQILKENIMKWGCDNVVVTNNSSIDYAASGLTFDLILCDVPCSGEGMFRKDPDSIHEWSEANVANCHSLQREIVSSIWDSLVPGGLLLYSTCTYNTQEDESNAKYIAKELGGIPLSVDLISEWHVDSKNYLGDSQPVYHFFPHKAKGEGFFVCGFRKPGEKSETKADKKTKRNKEREIKKSNSSTYLSWLTAPETFLIDSDDRNNIYAIPKAHQALIKKADKKLNVIHKGIHIGEMKGNTVKPAHGLSMSAHLNPSSFPSREVDTTTALSYLRCESLGFPDSPLGFLLLTYHGIPLGFVKNVGNRCNNLYPHEWRIRFK